MKITIKGKLNNVTSKDWAFNGKSGTSYKLVVYSSDDDALYKVKVSERVASEYATYIGQDIELETNVYFTGSYSLSLVE